MIHPTKWHPNKYKLSLNYDTTKYLFRKKNWKTRRRVVMSVSGEQNLRNVRKKNVSSKQTWVDFERSSRRCISTRQPRRSWTCVENRKKAKKTPSRKCKNLLQCFCWHLVEEQREFLLFFLSVWTDMKKSCSLCLDQVGQLKPSNREFQVFSKKNEEK